MRRAGQRAQRRLSKLPLRALGGESRGVLECSRLGWALDCGLVGMNRIGYHGQGGEYTIFTRNTAVAQQRMALQPLIQRKSVRLVARRGGNPPRTLGRLAGPALKVGGPRIALYANALLAICPRPNRSFPVFW